MNYLLINTNSNIPIYSQIAEMIEDQILNGDLRENEQVYSTNQLANLLNVNPATARKGLNILLEEEIIFKRRGLGMFTNVGAQEKIKAKRNKSFIINYIDSMIKEAKKIGLTKEYVIDLIKSVEWGDC